MENFLTRTGIKKCNSWDKLFVITWTIGCYTPQKYTLTSVAKDMFTYWARGRGLLFAPPNKMWLYFMSHVAYHLTRWFPKDDRKRMWVKNVFNESKWWFLCKQWALMKIPLLLWILGGFKCSRQWCPIHAFLFNCYFMEDGVAYYNLAPHLVVIVVTKYLWWQIFLIMLVCCNVHTNHSLRITEIYWRML